MSVLSLLDRDVYGMSQVDTLLRLPGGTARRWIDGYERRGREYAPVVREHSTGSEIATWGEFVEARLLAEYRGAGLAMLKLRPLVERLRRELGSAYPLATARPFVLGRELVARVQDEVGLEAPLQLVVVRTGQLVLAAPSKKFFDSTEWDDEVARQIHLGGRKSLVVLDPLVSSGQPTVQGIRTDVLAELIRAGESVEEVARAYDLSLDHVKAAVSYERAA